MDYKELSRKLQTGMRETERMILRPFCDQDEDGLFELFQDANTMRMDGDCPIHEKNEEFIRRINLIRSGSLIWIFAEEKISSGFVGYVMLQDEGEAVALGFAVTAVTKLLRENGVKEIRIKTWEKNTPCQKLAEKLGFEMKCIIRGDHKDPVTGRTGDSYLYSLMIL